MGETSDHVGITLIQLAPRRMSNVRPPNFKTHCVEILCSGSAKWSRLVTWYITLYTRGENLY